jgi:hypothetical protein
MYPDSFHFELESQKTSKFHSQHDEQSTTSRTAGCISRHPFGAHGFTEPKLYPSTWKEPVPVQSCRIPTRDDLIFANEIPEDRESGLHFQEIVYNFDTNFEIDIEDMFATHNKSYRPLRTRGSFCRAGLGCRSCTHNKLIQPQIFII